MLSIYYKCIVLVPYLSGVVGSAVQFPVALLFLLGFSNI